MKKFSFKMFALAAVMVCCMSASAAKPKFPLLDSAPYDTVIDGQKVALYTIKKGKVAAQIINYGGFVVGLYSPDKNGEYANLVNHYDDIHQYMRYNMGMIGPALGRYANRIATASSLWTALNTTSPRTVASTLCTVDQRVLTTLPGRLSRLRRTSLF